MKIKILLIALFVSVSSIGQDYSLKPNPHFPMTSEVWNFKKFGDISTNDYKGLVNISIPIHTIALDNVEIPLQLNYYSGGIRVSEEADIVGLGWSFTTPTIIQTIKGFNDYAVSANHVKLPPIAGNPAYPSEGPYFLYQINNGKEVWSTDINAIQSLPGYQNVPYFYNAAGSTVIDHDARYSYASEKYYNVLYNSSYDTEPDIFTVSLKGEEIKFCRKPSERSVNSTSPEILPLEVINGKTEYKVELISGTGCLEPCNGEYLRIKGIKITDPSGNQYFFEKFNNVYGESSEINTVNFKLTKVITFRNKEMLFEYLTVNNTVECKKLSQDYYRRTSSTYDNFISTNLRNQHFTNWGGNSLIFYNNSLNSFTENNLKTPIQRIDLIKSITTPEEKIILEYGDRIDFLNMKKLTSVEVKNALNQKVKKIDLSYDYFVSTDNLNSYSPNIGLSQYDVNIAIRNSNRLRLVSLTEEGHNPYLFVYNATNLPKKTSYSNDYWGFYNGKNNMNFCPNLSVLGYPQYTDNNSNDFNSDLAYAKACSLEKIIYPTKGYTKYEYELHHFDNLLLSQGPSTPVINTGGGLRIKTISNFNHDGNLIYKKKYSYFNGKNISKRNLVKGYNQSFGDCGNGKFGGTSVLSSHISNFLNNSNFDEGDYIGYDKVIIQEDGVSNNGHIEKTFSNNENKIVNGSSYSNLYHNGMFYSDRTYVNNGQLLTESVYDANGVLKSKTENNYFVKGFDKQWYGMAKSSYGYRVVVPRWDTNLSCYDNVRVKPEMLLTFYPIFDKSTFLSSSTTTEFYDGKSISKRKVFTYDSKNNIAAKEDFLLPNTQLMRENIIYTYSQNSDHLTKNILNLPYKAIIDQNGSNKLTKEFEYSNLNNAIQLTKEHILPEGNSDPAKKITTFYDSYDDKGNLTQFHRDGGLYTSIVWGYSKTLPIVKIENLQYAQIPTNIITAIQQASDSGNETNLLSQFNTLRNSLSSYPNCMITTFTYTPFMKLSSIIDAKEDTKTFEYDSSNRLKNVKDKNGNILSENEYHYKP